MSPLVWDLAHIGQQEELWLLRGGDPARPGMLPPDVDALYDAFKHPRADRAHAAAAAAGRGARLLTTRSAAGCSTCSSAPPPTSLFTAGMVVQHEEQHDETMLATLQLRQGPPVLLRTRSRCRRAAPVAADRVFVAGGPFVLGVDAADRAVLARQRAARAHASTSRRSGSAGCR